MNPYYIWAAIVACIPLFSEGYMIFGEILEDCDQQDYL